MMRKIIYGTVLLWAVVSTMAQVYSVNVVGYINLRLKPGFNLVANPLSTGSNTLAEIHPSATLGTLVYTFTPTNGFSIRTFDEGWLPDGNVVIEPGSGYFIRVVSESTTTYVGEVLQGHLIVPVVTGFNLVGSKVPEGGRLSTDMKYIASEGDIVYTYTPASGYTIFTYDSGEWLPSEPYIKAGEGFWIRATTSKNWERDFVVGP